MKLLASPETSAPFKSRPSFGDDVDDPEKRVGAIQCGPWAFDDFHAIDQIDVNRHFSAGSAFIIDGIVEPVIVDQQQDAGGIIAWPVEAADPQVAIVAVVAGKQAGHAIEDFIAKFL